MMKTFWIFITTIIVATATSPTENHHEEHNQLTSQHHKHHLAHVNHHLQHTHHNHANIDPIENSNEPIKTEKKEKRGLFNLYNQRPQAHIRQFATHPAGARYIVGYGPLQSSHRLLPIIRSIVPALQYKPAVSSAPFRYASKPQANVLRPPVPVNINPIHQQVVRPQLQLHNPPQPVHRPVVQQIYQTIKNPPPPTNHYLPPQRPVHSVDHEPPHHHVKPGIQAPVPPVEEPVHTVHTPVQFPRQPIAPVVPQVPSQVVPAQHPVVQPPQVITPVQHPFTQVVYPLHTHIVKPPVAPFVPVQTPVLKPGVVSVVPFQTPIFKSVIPVQPNPPVLVSSISPGSFTHHYKPIVPAQIPAAPVQPFVQNIQPTGPGLPLFPNHFLQPFGSSINPVFNTPTGNVPISPGLINPLLFKHHNVAFPSGNAGVLPLNPNIIKSGNSLQTSFSATYPRHPFIQHNFPLVPNLVHSQIPVASPPLLPQPIAPHPILPQPIAPQPVAPQPVIPQPIVPQPIVPQTIVPQPPFPHSINFHQPSVALQTPFIKNNHFIQAPFKQ